MRIRLRKVNAEEVASQQNPCPLPNCASHSDSSTNTRCKGEDKGRVQIRDSQGIGFVRLPQKDRSSYCLRIAQKKILVKTAGCLEQEIGVALTIRSKVLG